MPDQGGEVEYTVIGMVDDFNYASVHTPVESLLIFNNPANSRYLYVRIADVDQGLSRLDHYCVIAGFASLMVFCHKMAGEFCQQNCCRFLDLSVFCHPGHTDQPCDGDIPDPPHSPGKPGRYTPV